jgi:hypothetical protein
VAWWLRRGPGSHTPFMHWSTLPIHVGSAEHRVCVPARDAGTPNVRVFESTTGQLNAVADWFGRAGCRVGGHGEYVRTGLDPPRLHPGDNRCRWISFRPSTSWRRSPSSAKNRNAQLSAWNKWAAIRDREHRWAARARSKPKNRLLCSKLCSDRVGKRRIGTRRDKLVIGGFL